jgi:hypothetical protein
MNGIVLEKVNSSGSSVHVKLLIDNKDVGILYLKEEEADILLKCLKHGSIHSDITLECKIYSDDEDLDSDLDDY